MPLLTNPTRNLFFTGKGGVGKTSMACATAVWLAKEGQRVLLISTDPASNLHDVLATNISDTPTPITGVPRLFARNIDPAESARQYRERMVGPYRGILPDVAVASMEEQFSGSCTLEIAAFDEFSRLLGDESATPQYDTVIFDTAPTGHTLRLLTLPSAWSGFMQTNTTGVSCLGPLSGLQTQQMLYQQCVATLKDPRKTTIVLVTRPEASALREAARTSRELRQLGVENQQLIINGVFTAQAADDEFALAFQLRCEQALQAIPDEIASLPRTLVPLFPEALLGLDALKLIETPDASKSNALSGKAMPQLPVGLEALIDEIAAAGHGVVLTMGKGGVGKTTIAASLAVALADRGHQVLLSTTDPADHLASTLEDDRLPTLSVSRIDPADETARYTAEVMATAGGELDDQGRALLAEDLRSPCTEEIAIFRAFARTVANGKDRFVVLDTAPTGHTILLLDAALAYHRELTRQSSRISDDVENLLPRLRDPNFARMLIITLPEATPVHEAIQLQSEIRRAGIEPFAWVINQSLQPLHVSDPVLKRRRQNEVHHIHEVSESRYGRLALLPWMKQAPTGTNCLRQLARGLCAPTSPSSV